jgi:hemerythrin-like metal-binding protein
MLHSRLTAVREAVVEGMDPGRLAPKLADLIRYLERHFELEESIMGAASYPRMGQHKRAHDAFRRKVEELHEHLDLTSAEMTLVLVHLLERWLERHERVEDGHFSDFMKENS